MEDKKLINSKEVEFRDVSYTVTETQNFCEYNKVTIHYMYIYVFLLIYLIKLKFDKFYCSDKVTGTRDILKNVSGIFRNGELSAIMGPSGAGKSSLLNAISKYRFVDDLNNLFKVLLFLNKTDKEPATNNFLIVKCIDRINDLEMNY